jgi:tellurite resistance protein
MGVIWQICASAPTLVDTVAIETRDGTESGQIRNLPLCCPFRVSWGVRKTVCSLCDRGTEILRGVSRGWATECVAVVLLILCTLVIGALLVRTVMGIPQGEF